MFVNPTNNVGISQRVVATLVASAVLLTSIGFYNIAQAANLTSVSDTLSDSDLSSASNHTILATVPAGSAGVTAGQTVTVTFPAGFVLTGVTSADIDFAINGSEQTLAGAPAGATWGAAIAGQVLTLTSGTGVVTAGQIIRIRVGTNAVTGGTGTQQIDNPGTAGSYELRITAGTADSGRTRVAIIDNVVVSAIVDTTFTFTITGVATSTVINGAPATTGSTSPTAINFARIAANTDEVLGQRLNVTTNAIGGFTVTVAQDSNLLSSTGADIDGFADGAYTNTPAAWTNPTNSISLENTWGHWGLTSDDDLNTNEFGAALYVAASTTPRSVFHHAGPADGTTNNIGSTSVAYRIRITPLQEAADDYNTTLTYVATPIF
jgi:hypothetical protein